METKRFTKNDNAFICANCGHEVPPLKYTSRNHCPKCLCSLHLDVNPGDRASDCGGVMDPVTAEPDPKKGFIITHKCRKCGALSGHNLQLKLEDNQPTPENFSFWKNSPRLGDEGTGGVQLEL